MQAKSRLWFLLTIIILFSSLFVSQSKTIDGFTFQDNSTNYPVLTSINATSPTEYFNETSFPRYHLVARPLSIIQSPHKGFPAIIDYSQNISITAQADSDTAGWQFSLVSSGANITLDILESTYNEIDALWYFEVNPSENIAGLYDLQLNCSDGDDYQTNSVKIVVQKSYPFKILHISDSHIPSYAGMNTTDIVLDYIDQIKSLDVDFAIFTGDLIEGAPALEYVNPITGKPLAAEVQVKLGLWVFDLLDLPIYIIGGNHDLDESTLLPDNPKVVWGNYFGENYMNFNFLDWSFIGYTCTNEGLNASDLDRVVDILSTEEEKPNVLFYHSNYKNHASSLRASYNIEIMLYGHEHHEKKYVSASTLYHCEDAMFNNESSVITVLNRTCVSLDDLVYDFTTLLEISTEKTSYNYFIFTGILNLFIIVLILWRKKQNM
ncbi:MAG: metallophosphoesterase [Candidatus Heimdallarchaeota archaeon]|nr:metallophosphoesterase [Candidatus Heimdallarchaeota archaeon]MCK4611093.1 metallophosphoesterase [Candidatus Heimdallarchaeota archaeon]